MAIYPSQILSFYTTQEAGGSQGPMQSRMESRAHCEGEEGRQDTPAKDLREAKRIAKEHSRKGSTTRGRRLKKR